MILNRVLILGAALAPLAATAAHAAAPKSKRVVSALLAAEQTLNDVCRGGSGDSPSTMQACGDRDRIIQMLKAHGVCWGPTDAIEADKSWGACPPMPPGPAAAKPGTAPPLSGLYQAEQGGAVGCATGEAMSAYQLGRLVYATQGKPLGGAMGALAQQCLPTVAPVQWRFMRKDGPFAVMQIVVEHSSDSPLQLYFDPNTMVDEAGHHPG